MSARTNHYNLNAGETTLDLNALRSTLATAVRNARTELNRALAEVDDGLEKASRDEYRRIKDGDTDSQEYHHRHHASYHAKEVSACAAAYHRAVEAWFMVSEAICRGEVKLHIDPASLTGLTRRSE